MIVIDFGVADGNSNGGRGRRIPLRSASKLATCEALLATKVLVSANRPIHSVCMDGGQGRADEASVGRRFLFDHDQGGEAITHFAAVGRNFYHCDTRNKCPVPETFRAPFPTTPFKGSVFEVPDRG